MLFLRERSRLRRHGTISGPKIGVAWGSMPSVAALWNRGEVNILATPSRWKDPTGSWDALVNGNSVPRDQLRMLAGNCAYYELESWIGINSRVAGAPSWGTPLIQTIKQVLAIHTWTLSSGRTARGGCLSTLEIFAHGNPGVVNGANMTKVRELATGLMSLTLCDEVSLFLSACSTGCTSRGIPVSIAETLANLMPFRRGHFEHHIWVHGTAGTKRGSHMLRETRQWCTSVERNNYTGSRNGGGSKATEANCWNYWPNPGWGGRPGTGVKGSDGRP